MNNHSRRIVVVFSIIIFIIFSVTSIITGSLTSGLYAFNLIVNQDPRRIVVVHGLTCIIVGTLLAKIFSKRILQTIVDITNATKEITSGNYGIQINEKSQVIELQEMAQNFNHMAKELASTEILRNDFVENVSHEFKTPLATIEGYATLMQQPNLSEEKRIEYSSKIIDNTKRLSSLSGNILLLSRLENQEFDIKKETYDLSEQVREVILSLEHGWTNKDLELDIDLDEIILSGNKELLYQVCQNLLNNAIKFSSSNGVISIRLKIEHEVAVLTITDCGIGMNQDVCTRVFEKFYQGDTSRSTKGNGLGLPLCKRIIDLHSGNIIVSSEEGKGSEFSVYLPLY